MHATNEPWCVSQARKTLSSRLRFGDPEQIQAVKTIREWVEAMEQARQEGLKEYRVQIDFTACGSQIVTVTTSDEEEAKELAREVFDIGAAVVDDVDVDNATIISAGNVSWLDDITMGEQLPLFGGAAS